MSPEALVMEILRDGEMSGAEIARGFSWWFRWAAYGAIRRLERIGMITSRHAGWGTDRADWLYRAKDISLAPLRGGDGVTRGKKT